jgi:circadian clock protein KaiB
MLRYSFSLFVSDTEGKDRAAIDNVHNLCEVHLQRDYEISVIDVRHRPDLAEQARILATPALVKTGPLPRQCVVGDLADIDEVLRALSLWEEQAPFEQSNDSICVTVRPR